MDLRCTLATRALSREQEGEAHMGLTKKQLAFRRTGIGASEIAALAGESQYATPIAIYEAKVLGVELEATYQMDLGNEFEEPIARIWAKQENRFLARVNTLRHPEKKLAVATPDRAVYVTEAQRGDRRKIRNDVRDAERLLQVKSTNWRLKHLWGDEGTDRIPREYVCQAHWEGSVAGVAIVDFAVDIDKTRLYRYRVTVRPAVFEALYEIAERFWVDHVVPRRPPPPDATDRYTEFLKRVYPRETNATLVPIADSDPLLVDVKYFAQLKAGMDPLKKLMKLLQNRLLNRTGENMGITGSFGTITFKRTRDGETIDWELVANEAITIAKLVLSQLPEGDRRSELNAQIDALVKRHTTPRPGYRRLHAKWASGLQQASDAIELRLELLQKELENTASQSEVTQADEEQQP